MGSVKLRIIEIETLSEDIGPLLDRLLPPPPAVAIASPPTAPRKVVTRVDGRDDGAAPAEEPRHVHHWKIDSPHGPTSEGRCDCGAKKEFANSGDGDDFMPRPAGGRGRCKKCGHGSAHPEHRAHVAAE